MSFTDRQREVMYHAWRCFDAEPKVNYEKLAALAGFANAASANAFWHKIKVKLLSTPGSAGKCGTTSKPNGIANKRRGRLNASKSTSKKLPKLGGNESCTIVKMEAEKSRPPMQSIPLESGTLNDRSGHFNHRVSPAEAAAITAMSVLRDVKQAPSSSDKEET